MPVLEPVTMIVCPEKLWVGYGRVRNQWERRYEITGGPIFKIVA
jgi:hypothetical protein